MEPLLMTPAAAFRIGRMVSGLWRKDIVFQYWRYRPHSRDRFFILLAWMAVVSICLGEAAGGSQLVANAPLAFGVRGRRRDMPAPGARQLMLSKPPLLSRAIQS